MARAYRITVVSRKTLLASASPELMVTGIRASLSVSDAEGLVVVAADWAGPNWAGADRLRVEPSRIRLGRVRLGLRRIRRSCAGRGRRDGRPVLRRAQLVRQLGELRLEAARRVRPGQPADLDQRAAAGAGHDPDEHP